MERTRRASAKQSRPQPPAASRLTVKPKGNRRKQPQRSLWDRVPRPAAVADACGRALRRSVPALIGAGVLAAVSGTAWASYHFVTTSSRFAVTSIEVSGNQMLTDDSVLATTKLRRGDNVFRVNLAGVVHDLHDNPWIASVSAHRVLPHTIAIDVREHVPAAVVQLDELYLVDAEGHPFKRATIDDGAGLPIITGVARASYQANPESAAGTIRGALAALKSWREAADRPSIGEVHLGPRGNLTLVTYEHAISIQLGDLGDQLADRMQTFDATWAELSPAERARTTAIHLDARPDQVTVAFARSRT